MGWGRRDEARAPRVGKRELVGGWQLETTASALLACAHPPIQPPTQPVTHPARQLLDLSSDGRQPLAVGVLHNGNHQADGGLRGRQAGRAGSNACQSQDSQTAAVAGSPCCTPGGARSSTTPSQPCHLHLLNPNLRLHCAAASTPPCPPHPATLPAWPPAPPAHLHRDAAVHCVVLADEFGEP